MAGNHLTARAFLAREIQLAREANGISRTALGKAVFVSEGLVRAWEKGRYIPKPDQINQLEAKIGAAKGILSRLIDDLVSGEISAEWFGKWQAFEAQSTSLLSFETTVIPGLLQTPEYARAILRLNNKQSPLDLDEQVNARLERRQRVLEREDPPLFVVVLDESVLRHAVGGPKTMHDQLVHMIDSAERSEVIIHVIPFNVGAHAGFAGPFVIASFDGTDVAYVDNALRGDVVEQADDVAAIRRLWEMLRSKALPEKESLELISKVAREYGHEVEKGVSEQ